LRPLGIGARPLAIPGDPLREAVQRLRRAVYLIVMRAVGEGEELADVRGQPGCFSG
jgi:hypothetical protein